jgi:hypothetical protein
MLTRIILMPFTMSIFKSKKRFPAKPSRGQRTELLPPGKPQDIKTSNADRLDQERRRVDAAALPEGKICCSSSAHKFVQDPGHGQKCQCGHLICGSCWDAVFARPDQRAAVEYVENRVGTGADVLHSCGTYYPNQGIPELCTGQKCEAVTTSICTIVVKIRSI